MSRRLLPRACTTRSIGSVDTYSAPTACSSAARRASGRPGSGISSAWKGTGVDVRRSRSSRRCRRKNEPSSGLSSCVKATPARPHPHHFIPARGERVGSAVPVTLSSPSDGMMTGAPTDRRTASPGAPPRGAWRMPRCGGGGPRPGARLLPESPARRGRDSLLLVTEIAWNWSPSMPDTTPRAHRGPSRGSRIVALTTAAVLGLLAFGFIAAGGALLWGNSQKDDQGYFATKSDRFHTRTYALATDNLDVDADLPT